MSSKLGKIVADFRTSLATKISVGGTTASLQSNLDDDGIALPDGTYFFTIDGDSSQKEHIVATNTGGNLTDIKSISRQGVQTAGVKREHRVGAAVTITDFAHIKYLNDLLDGTTDLDGSKPLKYDIDPTISDDKHLATKKYVGDAFSGVVGTASSTVFGTTKLSSDPVTPNNPVALNSEEVSATSGANKVPKANANGLIDSGFIIDNAADSGLEEGANGGTKVKVKTAGGILIDADGLSVDTTIYPANTVSFPKTTQSAVAGIALAAGKLYRIATSTTTGTAQSTTNGANSGKKPTINSESWMFIPFDNSSSDFTTIVSFIANVYSVPTAGTITIKVYRLASSWNNANPTATLSGAVEVGTGSLAIGTAGVKVIVFSSPIIVDIKNYTYAFRFSTSDAEIVLDSPLLYYTGLAHKYKAFFSGDSGSSWSADNNYPYISDYNINVNPEVTGLAYLASTTVVDGIVTSDGHIGDTVSLQSSGEATLTGAVAGKMYYSDGSGNTTITPDGTKMSIGLGTDTNKVLIMKGIK